MSRSRHRIAAAMASIVALTLTTTASAAVIEVPAHGSNVSGIGYLSGWKCPPNDDISLTVDGGPAISVPSRVGRGDTSGACGNDGRNGYIVQLNFNLLREGFHTVEVRQGGIAFAQSTFHVATLGAKFLRGATGTYSLEDFPSPGQSTALEWVEGQQNFVITGTTGVGTGSEVLVRFANEIVCNNVDFVSTLSANGFQWSALSGKASEYQTIQNRSSLGPFAETNSTVCGDLVYPVKLPLPSGHAYTLVQTFVNGGPFLVVVDDGPFPSSAATTPPPNAASATAGAADAAQVGAPGVAAPGSGSFSAR